MPDPNELKARTLQEALQEEEANEQEMKNTDPQADTEDATRVHFYTETLGNLEKAMEEEKKKEAEQDAAFLSLPDKLDRIAIAIEGVAMQLCNLNELIMKKF